MNGHCLEDYSVGQKFGSGRVRAFIKARATTLNQNDEPVQVSIANLLVPRR